MIGAAFAWLRREAAPVSLAVLLHVIVGVLLFIGVGPLASQPNEMPGPGQEHEPIRAVTVSEKDYQAAEKSISNAQNARAAQVQKLKQQAAAAEAARKKTEQELARLQAQKQQAATETQQQQQQLQQLSSRSQQAQQQISKSQAQLAQLQQQAAEAQKQREAAEAELKKQQAAAAAAKKAAAEQQAKAEAARKAQLQAQVQAEAQQNLDKARGNWIAAIRQKVEQSWNRPPSTPIGLDCSVKITQLPSGQVISADMQQCNGDQAVQQSIITAIYKASPLPTPEDPGVFEREITFEFAPDQSS